MHQTDPPGVGGKCRSVDVAMVKERNKKVKEADPQCEECGRRAEGFWFRMKTLPQPDEQEGVVCIAIPSHTLDSISMEASTRYLRHCTLRETPASS